MKKNELEKYFFKILPIFAVFRVIKCAKAKSRPVKRFQKLF
jgi:hypothetical protein